MALTQIIYEKNTYDLSYEIIHPSQKKTLLILHGWGANKELMKQAFAKEFPDFCHLYLDLPGFGKSNIIKAFQSKDYVNIIKKFLKEKKIHVDIYMGHSFGGKIAALLALEFKNSKLILLSNSGILAPKSLKIRLKIIIFKFLKIFGLGKLYRYFASKDAANLNTIMYQTFKNVVDEDLKDVFSKIETKTYIFWGIDDQATPLSSGEKMHQIIKNSQFYPLEGDHFFFLRHSDFIAKQIQG